MGALVGGGALVVGAAGYLIYEAVKMAKQQQGNGTDAQSGADAEAPLTRENAVLVFGASGRTGRQIVAEVCYTPKFIMNLSSFLNELI